MKQDANILRYEEYTPLNMHQRYDYKYRDQDEEDKKNVNDIVKC